MSGFDRVGNKERYAQSDLMLLEQISLKLFTSLPEAPCLMLLLISSHDSALV